MDREKVGSPRIKVALGATSFGGQLKDADRARLLAAFDVGTDDRSMLASLEAIHRESTNEDRGWLVELLAHDLFVVREAAAWALSDLGIADAIPEMLRALRRGRDGGNDNDGLSAALADLAEAHPASVRAELQRVLASDAREEHEDARWLLEFCDAGTTP